MFKRYYSKPVEKSYLTTLKTKYFNYLEYIKKEQDVHSVVEHRKCDSLFFSGLVGSARTTIHIEKAKDFLGKGYCTPTHTCYNDGRSKSTISRDMFIG